MTFAVKWKIQAIDQFSRVAEQMRSANSRLTRSFEKLSKNTEGFNKSLREVGKRATDIGKTMQKRVSLPILATGGVMLKTASNFESAMNTVAATSNSTEEMFQRQRDAAIKAGSETVFSHTQAAEAMNALAMAGRSVSEQESMIVDTLNLASAGGLGLAESATVLNSALSAFDQQASQSQRFIDVFATAASIADTDIRMLSEGLTNSSVQATMAGQGFETTSAALGILANNGLKAGRGGTALGRMFSSLINPSNEAQKAFEQANIALVDSDTGKMRHVADILSDLKQAMELKPGEDVSKALFAIFGDIGARSASILIRNLDAFVDAERTLISESSGAAVRMAKRRIDGVTGAVQMLGSAFQDVSVSFFDEETMAFIERQIIWFRNNVVTPFANFVKQNPSFKRFVVIMSGLLLVLGPLVFLFGKLMVMFAAMKFIGIAAGGFALLASKILLVASALALVAANWDKIEEKFSQGSFNQLVAKITGFSPEMSAFLGGKSVDNMASTGVFNADNMAALEASVKNNTSIDVNINDKNNNVSSVNSRSNGPVSVNLGSNLNALG